MTCTCGARVSGTTHARWCDSVEARGSGTLAPTARDVGPHVVGPNILGWTAAKIEAAISARGDRVDWELEGFVGAGKTDRFWWYGPYKALAVRPDGALVLYRPDTHGGGLTHVHGGTEQLVVVADLGRAP